MSKSNPIEIEQGIGTEIDHFIYRVPKKNHDSIVQLSKEFSEMEGMTNVANTVSATQDEDVWLELIFYRDHNHRDEVRTKMRADERMGPLWRRSVELVTPGTGFIMGEFNRLTV